MIICCILLQIKVRGMRVELGEIENVLASNPTVQEVQVSVVKHGTTQQPTVVAYATPASVDIEAILDKSNTQLPEHMVPATVIPMEEMPLLPSGKVGWLPSEPILACAVEMRCFSIPCSLQAIRNGNLALAVSRKPCLPHRFANKSPEGKARWHDKHAVIMPCSQKPSNARILAKLAS